MAGRWSARRVIAKPAASSSDPRGTPQQPTPGTAARSTPTGSRRARRRGTAATPSPARTPTTPQPRASSGDDRSRTLAPMPDDSTRSRSRRWTEVAAAATTSGSLGPAATFCSSNCDLPKAPKRSPRHSRMPARSRPVTLTIEQKALLVPRARGLGPDEQLRPDARRPLRAPQRPRRRRARRPIGKFEADQAPRETPRRARLRSAVTLFPRELLPTLARCHAAFVSRFLPDHVVASRGAGTPRLRHRCAQPRRRHHRLGHA